MGNYRTDFGSIHQFKKGGVTVIDDQAKKYVFSNMFEVAAKSKPYERTAVAKNFEYVIESVRAEGTSAWYTTAHDEFVLSMDGEVEVHLVKLADPDAVVDPESEGAHKLEGNPDGKKMGRIVLRQGTWRCCRSAPPTASTPRKVCTLMIQTIDGPETVHKWAEICQQ